MKNRMVLMAALLVAPVVAIDAQPGRGGPDRGGMRGQPTPQQRQQLEQRLQAYIDSIVQVRLSPTEEQFAKLRDVATRIERERRELRMEEGQMRVELRRELMASTINEEKITELLDRMPRMERRRLDLMEREQRELAKFLSPSQRARYVALQDELRRNMQEMQRSRLDGDTAHKGGRGGPPGGHRVPPPR